MIRTIKWFRSIYVRNVCLTWRGLRWPQPYRHHFIQQHHKQFIFFIFEWIFCYFLCYGGQFVSIFLFFSVAVVPALYFSLTFTFSIAVATILAQCFTHASVVMISGYYFRCFMSDPDKRFNYPYYVNKLNSFTDFGFGVPPFHMPHYRINVYLLGIFGSIIVHFLHRTFVAFSFFSFIIMCL